jgi:uspA2
MNKVKKNAAGNSVACAKGHAKKAVLGSLLIIGALGMATTASAADKSLEDIQNTIEELAKKIKSSNGQGGNQQLSDVDKLLLHTVLSNTLITEELNQGVEKNKSNITQNKEDINFVYRKLVENKIDIEKNNDSIDDLYEANNENVERLIEHDRAIQILAEAGNHHDELIRNLYTYNEHQDEYARQQSSEIEGLIQASSANTDRIATAELGIAENKKDALIAKAQADKNRNHIQDLAKAQLAGVTVMEELNKNVEENKRDLSTVTRKAFKNQIDIQRNNDSIEDLYAYGEQVANSIGEIHDHNRQQNETIGSLITNSTDNTKRIATAESNITKNKSGIKTLVEAQLASAQKIANLDKNVADTQTDIANNKITLAQHTKQINENKQAIEAKLGDKADLQKLAELKTSVDKNQANIADNINNIHKLAQQQDQHGSDIRTLAKAGITNKDAIAKNTQSITTLDSKVNTFDGRISALDAKVNGFDGRINALDDKFKNGMAAQAALNGLFQPYSVGKVSVSAAIGGYGSKSAIAIGAGYRVNPQLAFKGGTAINVSGSKKGSYNIGVNYEF